MTEQAVIHVPERTGVIQWQSLPRRIVTPPMKLESVRTLGDAFLHVRYSVMRSSI